MSENPVLNLGPFLAVARDLTALLVPVRPRPAFRHALEANLVAAARQHRALETLDIAAPVAHLSSWHGLSDWRELVASGRERRWVVGAAAVGSAVSAAGIVAYLWHQRGQRAA